MGWKNWPSWLKGGVILGLIPLVVFIIVFSIYLINPNISGTMDSPLFFIIVFLIFMGEGGFTGALLGILVYFIIGSIIGWLISKFKK